MWALLRYRNLDFNSVPTLLRLITVLFVWNQFHMCYMRIFEPESDVLIWNFHAILVINFTSVGLLPYIKKKKRSNFYNFL